MASLKQLLETDLPPKRWGYEIKSDHFTDDARAVAAQVDALHTNLELHIANWRNARICAQAAGEAQEAWTAIEVQWASNPEPRRQAGFDYITTKAEEVRAAAARFLTALDSEETLDEESFGEDDDAEA